MSGYRPPGSVDSPAPAASSSAYNNSSYNPSGYGQSTQPAASSTSAYNSSYNPSGYGGQSTQPASTSSYNPSYSSSSYGGQSSSQPATNNSSYSYGGAPAPAAYSATPATSSGYNPNPTTTRGPVSNSNNSMPGFSQALDVPPPAQSSYQAQSSAPSTYQQQTMPATRSPNDFVGGGSYPAATGGPVAASAANSTVYSGGPTLGLVSEGNPTKCHKVDYEIKGHEMQLVEVELDPQETVIAEAGAMMFLDDGIEFKTKFGDGSEPKQTFFKKLMSAGGRLLTGESLFITHFTNKGQAKARVAFAAPFPGMIVPLNMANYNNKIICQKDAFLCAAHGTSLKIHFNKRIGSGLFGGEGFILQKLQGDGMAFIHAGGTIIKRELRGEKLRLDTGCLVAFTEGINFDIQLAPGLKSILFGGEGLFLATLQGTGTVWLQSLPFSRMCDRILQSAPSAGGRRQGEGSGLTGGLGDLIDGDNNFGMLGRF